MRPLGVVHALTFEYDERIPFMSAVDFLFAYEGGPVTPGDDMAGSAFHWWGLAELRAQEPRLLVPSNGDFWIIERAIQLHRLWKDTTLPRIPHMSGAPN